MFKTLVKANDDLISYCKCEGDAYAVSGQADCPWCGCGWLFTCLNCGHAFTFAKIVCAEVSPEGLAQREMRNWGIRDDDMDSEEIEECIAWFKEQTEGREVGEVCAILDGTVIPISSRNIAFEGWMSKHQLDRLPQVEALSNRAILGATIGSVDYWVEREIEDRDMI